MNSDSLFKKTSSDMSDVNKLNMCKKLNMSESNNIKCKLWRCPYHDPWPVAWTVAVITTCHMYVHMSTAV